MGEGAKYMLSTEHNDALLRPCICLHPNLQFYT